MNAYSGTPSSPDSYRAEQSPTPIGGNHAACYPSACRTSYLGFGHTVAAFELHQATERYLHTVLLVFTAYKPKTHNLEILAKRCADLHPELRGVFPERTPDEMRLFKLLKAAYVDARYNTSYAVSKEELEILAG